MWAGELHMRWSAPCANVVKSILGQLMTASRSFVQPCYLDCRQELQAAQGQIEELYSRVKAIQTKAEESENMVQEICK